MSSKVFSISNGIINEENITATPKKIKSYYQANSPDDILIWCGTLTKNDTKNEFIIFVPSHLTADNYQKLLEFLKSYISITRITLYNFRIVNGKIQYDYISNCHNGKESNILESLSLFYHEKINKLSVAEQQLIANFREFDLEKLLTRDEDIMPFSSYSSAVIIITQDGTIYQTVTAENHSAQASNILSEIYAKTFPIMQLEDLVNENVVIVQILYDEIIFWFNNSINLYQISSIEEILSLIKEINHKSQIQIIVGGEMFHQSNYFIANNIEELETYLNSLKSEKRKK